jgi:hypothetical protein
MKKYLLALAAVLGCSAISTASSAAVITATWQGTVASFIDKAGSFGSAGANLAGDGYKLVFTMDDSQGSFHPFPSGEILVGGMSAILTIGGQDHNFLGNNLSFDVAANGATNISGDVFSQTIQDINTPAGSVSSSIYSLGSVPGLPESIYTAFATSTCPSTTTCGTSFSINFNPGTLNFGSYSVSATPIPATLPLFISALGGLGFVGWRHRKMAA